MHPEAVEDGAGEVEADAKAFGAEEGGVPGCGPGGDVAVVHGGDEVAVLGALDGEE